VDPATRAVTARAQFSNPGERIKPGMLLRVGVTQGSRQAVAVPESAVRVEGDAAFVYAVTPAAARSGPGGQGAPAAQRAGGGAQGGGRGGGGLTAQRRPVEVGVRQGGLVEIVSGLQPGQRIVAEGLNRVNPNQPVRIAGAGGGGQPGGRPGGGAGAPRGAAQ
jgi:membrane fusion protein (multidrug efflux system)